MATTYLLTLTSKNKKCEGLKKEEWEALLTEIKKADRVFLAGSRTGQISEKVKWKRMNIWWNRAERTNIPAKDIKIAKIIAKIGIKFAPDTSTDGKKDTLHKWKSRVNFKNYKNWIKGLQFDELSDGEKSQEISEIDARVENQAVPLKEDLAASFPEEYVTKDDKVEKDDNEQDLVILSEDEVVVQKKSDKNKNNKNQKDFDDISDLTKLIDDEHFEEQEQDPPPQKSKFFDPVDAEKLKARLDWLDRQAKHHINLFLERIEIADKRAEDGKEVHFKYQQAKDIF